VIEPQSNPSRDREGAVHQLWAASHPFRRIQNDKRLILSPRHEQIVSDAEPKPSRDREGAVHQTKTYFITFACYGGRLHGNESGSVDRNHNLPGSRTVDVDPERANAELGLMDQWAYSLDAGRRVAVLDAVREVCLHRDWSLLAAQVRTNHVHLVVRSDVRPEQVMNAFKSYASRRLNRLSMDEPDQKRWARHGSTRWLWTDEDVSGAIRYVVEGQGEPMAVFVTSGS